MQDKSMGLVGDETFSVPCQCGMTIMYGADFFHCLAYVSSRSSSGLLVARDVLDKSALYYGDSLSLLVSAGIVACGDSLSLVVSAGIAAGGGNARTHHQTPANCRRQRGVSKTGDLKSYQESVMIRGSS